MSDRHHHSHQPAGLRRALLGAAAALALLVPAPAAAGDCSPISAHFVFCAEGSNWAGAEWVQFGDGASVVRDGLTFDFTEHWVARDDDQPLDAALDALLFEMTEIDDNEGMATRTLARDGFESGALQVVRAIRRIDFDDDDPLTVAVMLAQAGAARIALILAADGAPAPEVLDREAHALVALIHPARER